MLVSIDFAALLERCKIGRTSSADADQIESLMPPKQRVVQSALLTRVRQGLTTSYDAKVLERLCK